jgi:hypothetical protein
MGLDLRGKLQPLGFGAENGWIDMFTMKPTLWVLDCSKDLQSSIWSQGRLAQFLRPGHELKLL